MKIAEENEGFISNDLITRLDELNIELKSKIENICFVIRNLNHEQNTIDSEIKRLTDLKNSRKKNVERLKNYISSSMELNGLEEVKTATQKISFRASTSVEITNESEIPANYKTIDQKIKIDKRQLLKDLKIKSVKGANLVNNKNLQIK